LGFDDPRGYFTIVGPHEIAHQWWGHTVGFNSYRDQWISEGFAEMSASIFIQFIQSQKNLDPYHKFWADERWLLNREDNQHRKAYQVGPVTLGYRLINGKSGGSVPRELIYPKGGYILQMVRYMLRNERSNDPDVNFKRMMHDFVKTYTNKIASTEDFKAVLEKYMTPEMDLGGNRKMDWFFDEYVYGTDYPKHKFEHSFKTDGNGDAVVHFKLTQSNVSDNFRMLVPLYLVMNDGRVIRLGGAKLVGNRTIEQDFPLKGLQDKPKRMVAAYYDDVLGDFENK
jgi:aminopeptidase N